MSMTKKVHLFQDEYDKIMNEAMNKYMDIVKSKLSEMLKTYTVREIAMQTGTTPTSIYRFLHSTGMDSNVRRKPTIHITDQQVDDMVRLRKDGLSYWRIASALGVRSGEIVSKCLKRRGWTDGNSESGIPI